MALLATFVPDQGDLAEVLPALGHLIKKSTVTVKMLQNMRTGGNCSLCIEQ